ncbi:MAG: NAD(P)-dependent oxidoreductase [Acidimicrobiia bacterium]|nr:NAD(P)-dependent oxidoreductase [Acidimicrobiia bacterium]
MTELTPATGDIGAGEPSAIRVGFSGLGRMGSLMAANLQRAGFDLTVHNRTHAKAESFAASTGAKVATSGRELAEASSIIVTMVADGPALASLLEGPDGIAAGLSPGDIVVDMGTTGLEYTQRARLATEVAGGHLVEAPVSGSTAAAEGATLLVMTAGDEAAAAAAGPVLAAMSARIVHVGGPGAGAALKLAVNSALFAVMQAVGESLVLAERAGVPREVAYEVFASSAIAAPVVKYRREVFEKPRETPVSFALDLAIKDLDLTLALAGAVGAPMPQAETNRAVLREASAAGLGGADIGQIAVHLRGGP